jgi:cytochrome bd-type quinol oxidase subunit 1
MSAHMSFYYASAGDIIIDQLEDGSVTHNRFYAVYYKIAEILASFYSFVWKTGWVLLIAFAVFAILMFGISRDERKSAEYKNWLIRIIIASAVFGIIPQVVGWIYVAGSLIGK